MALVHSPSIVTNGLVLFVDAANPRSYGGTGTTWTDLTGNGNNGTLMNMTSDNYSKNKRGLFTLDGINETIRFGTGQNFFPLYNFSMEIWFRSDGTTPTTGTVPGLLGFTYGIGILVDTNRLRFRLDNGTSLPLLDTPQSYSFFDSSWHNTVIQATLNSRSIFIDGSLAATQSFTWSGQTRWPTNTVNLGRDNNDANYYFTGAISLFSLYNRALTADEIRQNYDALKGRFGI